MAYDFSSIINTAAQVVNENTSSGAVRYPYPLVYPQKGQTIVVKLLFNPASGQIVRLIRRHEKIPCYRSYGLECPICKIQEQVQATTGQDPFTKNKSKSRGISFAQYISSTQPIEVGGEGHKTVLKPGDTILFMYPWSVYTQVNANIQAVAQTPSGMEKALTSADGGLFMQISATNDFKYTTVLIPYMTYTSGMTDEQFTHMLDNMPNLMDQVIPQTITPEVDAQVKEYVNGIYQQFINPRVPNQTPMNQMPMNMGMVTPTAQVTPAAPVYPTTPVYQAQPTVNPVNPINPLAGANMGAPSVISDDDLPFTMNDPAPTQPATATGATSNQPTCFGQHMDNSPKCIICPYEIPCIQAKA